jgi:hypothetical protein
MWCTERVGESDRLLGGVLRGGDHRKAAHPRRLDALPLGEATIPTIMSPIDGSSNRGFYLLHYLFITARIIITARIKEISSTKVQK